MFKYTMSSELQRREWAIDEQLVHVPPMTRPNTVAVISPKGGVGKTTISFLLGNLLAAELRMRVVALDANPDLRHAGLAGARRFPLPALAGRPAGRFHADRLTGRAAPLRGPPAHRPASPGRARARRGHGPDDPGLYSRLLDFLERFYEVVIPDLGTGITDPLAQFAVDRADQTVVITTPEWVTAAGVLGALRYLQLEQGTLVLNQAPVGRHADNREVIEANFRRHAVETSATIPYDDRLRVMLDAVTYSLRDLKLSTRVPVKELGAAIAFNFV
jgi:MinD-like ATPase involved in chromosome partitioning or flagellar assembly